MKQPTLSLRLGTNADVDIIVDLGRDLFNNSIYRDVSSFNANVLRDNYLRSCDLPLSEFCTVLLKSGDTVIGFISCGHAPNQFSKDKYACELGFWIMPEEKTFAGMKMLVEAFYYWAKETGCVAALMGKLQDGKVESYKLKVLK